MIQQESLAIVGVLLMKKFFRSQSQEIDFIELL